MSRYGKRQITCHRGEALCDVEQMVYDRCMDGCMGVSYIKSGLLNNFLAQLVTQRSVDIQFSSNTLTEFIYLIDKVSLQLWQLSQQMIPAIKYKPNFDLGKTRSITTARKTILQLQSEML